MGFVTLCGGVSQSKSTSCQVCWHWHCGIRDNVSLVVEEQDSTRSLTSASTKFSKAYAMLSHTKF